VATADDSVRIDDGHLRCSRGSIVSTEEAQAQHWHTN